ncbi:unnamed protein product [Camellia sinensis]
MIYPPLSDGMESASGLDVYTYEELESITKGFSTENFIRDTQFGKVFRGKIQHGLGTQEVTVKIWEDCKISVHNRKPQESRLRDEIKLLTNSGVNWLPNLVKLIGYCCENGRLGVVYQLQPLDTVENLLIQDDFKWIARIKVALGFAHTLEVLHGQELLLRNVDGNHIMVDKAFNPILFDFSMLVGGVFGGIPQKEYFWGRRAYVDPYICKIGDWLDKTDVFCYGVLLLGLISKRVYDLNERERLGDDIIVHLWAKRRYKKRKCKSLVHNSLKNDPFFDVRDGVEITKLAMRCVRDDPKQRPTMSEVVCCLQELFVFLRSHTRHP